MNFEERFSPLRFSILLTMFLCFLPSAGRAATIANIQANSTSVALYDRYELSFDLNGVSPSNYNPFRPETSGDSLSTPGVDVWAQVSTPSGQTVKVWGFWDVDFDYLGQVTEHNNNGWDAYDRFVPASDPYWKIRYAPTQLGTYQVRVYATDQTGTTSSSVYQFTCTQSSLKGFIKVASDGQRFTYSNGDPYVPMGTRIVDNVAMREDLLPKFKENGMNFCRTWIVNGNRGDIHRELFPQTWALTNASYDTGTYHSGTRSVKLSCSSGEAWQTFVGVRNAAFYKAAAWIKTSSDFNGTAAVQIMVRYSDNSTKTYTGNVVGGGSSWKQSISNFTTSVSGKSAEFVDYRIKILSGSSGNAWVDDAELYETTSTGSIKYDYNYLSPQSFEPWTPAQLRLQPLWRLEYFLERGEQYGVAIEACIFDYRLWNTGTSPGLYAKYYGDFWSSSDATAQEDRALRYLVARYSSFRSLFAWELTNEMDPSYTTERSDWITNRANFIKKNDPMKHMVDNSYWSSPGDPRSAQNPALDLNEFHFYLNTEERDGGQGVPGWWNQKTGMVIDRNSSNAHTGTSSLKFTANGTTLQEAQNACLIPGHNYTVSYWVKTSSVNGSASSTIRIFGIDGKEVMNSITLSSSGTSAYTNKRTTFTASASCQRLSITAQLTGSAGTAWFDDIQVIDNSNGKNVFYNGGFESPNFGDDEFEWAIYNTFQVRQMEESGPNPTKKPFISGEFGLMGLNANLSAWADPTSSAVRHDTTGIHIHNCAWADFVASSALHTPTYWWVEQYIMAYNLTGVWKGITTFASEIPFYERGSFIATDPYLADVKAQSSNSQIRLLGQMRSNTAYCWIQNSQYSWSRIVRAGLNPSAASANISIPGFGNGTYSVDWYDTRTGQIIRSESKSVTSGTLTLSVSTLTTDAAVIIKPGSDVSNSDGSSSSSPNVAITISADKTTVTPGTTITYTVTYKNTGSATAQNVTISSPVPSNTTYVTGSVSNSGKTDTSAKILTWNLSSISAGASGTVTYKVYVN